MGVSGTFWLSGIAFATVGIQAIGFVFSAVVTALLTRGDRERLVSLVSRVAGARAAAT